LGAELEARLLASLRCDLPQARHEGLRLVSADQSFEPYGLDIVHARG
jgi:hypothetical protein